MARILAESRAIKIKENIFGEYQEQVNDQNNVPIQ